MLARRSITNHLCSTDVFRVGHVRTALAERRWLSPRRSGRGSLDIQPPLGRPVTTRICFPATSYPKIFRSTLTVSVSHLGVCTLFHVRDQPVSPPPCLRVRRRVSEV